MWARLHATIDTKRCLGRSVHWFSQEQELGPGFWLWSTNVVRLAKRTSPIDSNRPRVAIPRFSCSRPLSRLRFFTLANLVPPYITVWNKQAAPSFSPLLAALSVLLPPRFYRVYRAISRGVASSIHFHSPFPPRVTVLDKFFFFFTFAHYASCVLRSASRSASRVLQPLFPPLFSTILDF